MGKRSYMRCEQVSKSIVAGAVSPELSYSLPHWDFIKAVLIKLALDIQNYLLVFLKRSFCFFFFLLVPDIWDMNAVPVLNPP